MLLRTDSDEQCLLCGEDLEFVEHMIQMPADEDGPAMDQFDEYYECPECGAQFDEWMERRF